MSDSTRARTDELKTGDRLVAKDMTRFTVDSVTLAKVDWRFEGRDEDGSRFSDSGMEIVGHDESGEDVRFTAAQSYLWYRDVEAEKTAAAVRELGALPMPVGPEPEPSIEAVLLADALGHGEFLMRDVLRLRARVTELETGIAWRDAERERWVDVHALVERAIDKGWSVIDTVDLEAELGPEPAAAVDGLTRRIAPSQALREDEAEAVRRSVDARFPKVAAFLAEESKQALGEDTADIVTLAPAHTADAVYDSAFRMVELELTATREQWAVWQDALKVDLARTTYRGGSVTSHAMWRGLRVVVRCRLVSSESGGAR